MSRKIAQLCVSVSSGMMTVNFRVYVCVRSDSEFSLYILATSVEYFWQIQTILSFFKKLKNTVSFTALFLSYGTPFPIEVLLSFFLQILLIPSVLWGVLTYAVCHAGIYFFKDNPALNGIVKPFCSKVWCLI